MPEVPETSLGRTARLAALPLSAAGRLTKGWGQRMLGADRDQVNATFSQRTADQIFRTLGTLKGGAMKFGQALSLYEAAVPEEFAAPYRESLTKLQNAAPPMPREMVEQVLAEQLGRKWRERFAEFDDEAAAASIGQVHRARWHDGREVAVKIQYPSADRALSADLRQLARIAPLLRPLFPGTDIKALVTELGERVMEELDYTGEANNQRAFARAFADVGDFLIPRVLASAPKVIVSEWVSGTDLSAIIVDGSQAQRDRCGFLLTELHFSAPTRVGLLHADPHPGNYKLTDDNRLAVMDFGSIAHLPDGAPPVIATASRYALDGRADRVIDLMTAEGFIPDGYDVDSQVLINYLLPFLDPLRSKEFTFTREWLQERAAKMNDLRSAESKLARRLNLPASYLMIYRVTFGAMAVLCQLRATAPYRDSFARWQPGFTATD